MRCLIILVFLFSTAFTQTFFDQQCKTPRFIVAKKEKQEFVKELFASKGLSFPNIEILLRAFKNDETLELWGRAPASKEFILIRTYKICSNSGGLGPKRRIGDGQVPEGCYFISTFNPYSNFYLSLGINYPNQGDRIAGGNGNLGGDIFIHGDCVTIGCIPITDAFIKELYYICVCAKSNGQKKIPVYIFPLRMDDKGMRLLKEHFDDAKLLRFWSRLRSVYERFEATHDIVGFSFDTAGEYVVK